MSFGRDMAMSVGQQAIALLVIAFLLGGIFVAALIFGIPWLWEHINIVVK